MAFEFGHFFRKIYNFIIIYRKNKKLKIKNLLLSQLLEILNGHFQMVGLFM